MRQRRNQIKSIFYDGRWISSPEEMKVVFKSHFEHFFSKQGPDNIMDISPLIKHKLSEESKNSLESSFEKGYLFAALHSMDSNKCPGPDGLNAKYIKEMWYLIHDDVHKMAATFYDSCSFPPGMNSSFISLIPKRQPSILVSDFRPISLINCIIKVVLKLLANRLGKC